MKQRRVQDNVPAESQDHHSWISLAIKRDVSSQREAYGEPKSNRGVVDQREKWQVNYSILTIFTTLTI